MKVVLNRDWGGFKLPEGFCKKYGYDKWDDISREDSRLIQWLLDNADEDELPDDDGEVSCGELSVIELPDEATDYDFFEYDGAETLIYVIDGKIHYA